MSQHYAYIAVHSAHINLGFYQGASLPDPASLLEGSGKALPHVKVNDLAVIKSAALETLLRVAITERTPYADRVSDGSVHTNTTLPITSRR